MNTPIIINNIATFNIKILTSHNKLDGVDVNTSSKVLWNLFEYARIEIPVSINKYINGHNTDAITKSRCVLYISKNVYNTELYDLNAEIQLHSYSNYLFNNLFSNNGRLRFELIGNGSIGFEYKIKGILIQ